jgi:hypothetical protein
MSPRPHPSYVSPRKSIVQCHRRHPPVAPPLPIKGPLRSLLSTHTPPFHLPEPSQSTPRRFPSRCSPEKDTPAWSPRGWRAGGARPRCPSPSLSALPCSSSAARPNTPFSLPRSTGSGRRCHRHEGDAGEEATKTLRRRSCHKRRRSLRMIPYIALTHHRPVGAPLSSLLPPVSPSPASSFFSVASDPPRA